MLAMVCFACSGEQPNDVAVTAAERSPDITYEEPGFLTKFYDSDNPYTKEVLDQLTDNARVRAELGRFKNQGYTLRPDGSFVSEGEDGSGRQMEMAVLSLGAASADARDAVYLFCYGGADPTAVVPAKLTLEDKSAAGYVKAGDGVWFGIAESAFGETVNVDDPSYAWNWRRWANCVGSGILAGTITCAFHCRWVPVIYVKCTTICSLGRAAAVALQCSIMEM